MERNTRKTLTGIVTRISGTNTIYVEVENYRSHNLYSKRFRTSKRFAVHDENNVAKLNDVVVIMETRPLSKTKHFRLVEVKQHATQGAN